ncbi:TELO2-interacting protein 2-like [Halichondria panicea]|uniref:TELO2-interacting protein 2-like n=1 Tax=Halichondria panicea TaxID=6063 RepID=UPI00312BBA6B
MLSLCKALQSVKSPHPGDEVSEGISEDTSTMYESGLTQLLSLLNDCDKVSDESHLAVAHAVITGAGHCGKHYWTSTVSRQIANDIISRLIDLTNSGSVQQLLAGGDKADGSRVLATVLLLIREKLTKEKWKEYPIHKHALVWCIKHLKHPNVSPYLDTFLPATLMMLDDYTDYHRILALGLASHIVCNVDSTELRWYNRADVIYQAIKPLLYGSAPNVSNAVHTCLLHLLPVLDAYHTDIPAKPNKSSEVFELLINSLHMESNLAAKKVYAFYVSKYIELLGIFCVRHMKLLLTVLISCIEDSYFPETSDTQRYALKSLATLITHAWPRIPSHKDSILKCLVRVVSDLCTSSTELPQDKGTLSQLSEVSQCFKLLQTACPEVEEHYKALMSDCEHAGLIHCLKCCFS